MSGEYLIDVEIGNPKGKKVFIVKGGWSCNAGYIVWAYVAEDKEKSPFYATLYDKHISRIGKRLFEPPNILNSKYEDELLNKCVEFVKNNNYICNMIITMRTD